MQAVNPNGQLAGQVAVVTGASRGIGEYVAKRYAMEGARVVACARTVNPDEHFLPGTITKTVADIRAAGGEALAVQANLGAAADRERLIEETTNAFGPVDILVNNAAVTYYNPVPEFRKKHFDLMLEVQVWGPYHLAQMVLPEMLARAHGRILNVSSHAAIHPDKTVAGKGGTVYGMCKAALERFTTGLAQETYGKGVGVNVISPGLVATPGAVHHNLISEATRNRETPVEHMAEACLRLVTGDPAVMTGRIDYADDVMREFALTAAQID
ncbi:MAG: SDR family NAD(P)-dependent oxidoreductase [Pseudomonadota bacterium]